MKKLITSIGVAAAGLFVVSGAAIAAGNEAGLEDRVEEKLEKDKDLKAQDVSVDVAQGVTVLNGSVPTSVEKAKAEQLARSAGAKKVDNRLGISDVDADAVMRTAKPAATAGPAKGASQGTQKPRESSVVPKGH